VLLNRGDGTFASFIPYDVGGSSTSVTSADLDGDGHVDLVANASGGSVGVSVLLNQGDGTFGTYVRYNAGASYSMTTADLDGDGHPDLVAVDGSKSVWVLINRGDGTFGAYAVYGTGASATSVTTADLDGDGDLDLITTGSAWGACVLLNQGDGTFGPNVGYEVGGGPWSVTCADLDGDGDMDLATANSISNTVSVLLNTCGCSAPSWRNYGAGWSGSNGIPSFTTANEPRLCTEITLDLANSLVANTTAALFVGLAKTDQPTIYGGRLLVAPTIVLILPLPAGGLALPALVPCNPLLCGVSIFLQALEVDGGASRGVSFTPGLQLVLGS
jgi:hypothetical protein